MARLLFALALASLCSCVGCLRQDDQESDENRNPWGMNLNFLGGTDLLAGGANLVKGGTDFLTKGANHITGGINSGASPCPFLTGLSGPCRALVRGVGLDCSCWKEGVCVGSCTKACVADEDQRGNYLVVNQINDAVCKESEKKNSYETAYLQQITRTNKSDTFAADAAMRKAKAEKKDAEEQQRLRVEANVAARHGKIAKDARARMDVKNAEGRARSDEDAARSKRLAAADHKKRMDYLDKLYFDQIALERHEATVRRQKRATAQNEAKRLQLEKAKEEARKIEQDKLAEMNRYWDDIAETIGSRGAAAKRMEEETERAAALATELTAYEEQLLAAHVEQQAQQLKDYDAEGELARQEAAEDLYQMWGLYKEVTGSKMTKDEFAACTDCIDGIAPRIPVHSCKQNLRKQVYNTLRDCFDAGRCKYEKMPDGYAVVIGHPFVTPDPSELQGYKARLDKDTVPHRLMRGVLHTFLDGGMISLTCGSVRHM